MMPPEGSDDRLRAAFRSLADAGHGECADVDRIWDAVTGRLPAAERRLLVDKLSRDPDCAEVWRLASDLWREAEAAERQAVARRPARPGWAWAAVAAVAAVLSVTALGPLLRQAAPLAPVHRGAGAPPLASRLPEGGTLPRSAFHLAWQPLADGVRYTVRLSTDDLALAYVMPDLRQSEYRVPEAVLSRVPSGSRVLWSVEARRLDGTIVSSGTFAVRLAD